VYGLIESGNLGVGHPLVLTALAISVVALLMFLLVEVRSRVPMLPLSLFRSPTFSGANVLTLLLYVALGGALFFVPFNLIRVQGYSPAAAGAANLTVILILFLLSRWSGGLVSRYGAKLPLIIGPLIAAAGFALFARPGGIGGSYWTTFFPAAVVLDIGMAVSVAPLTTVVMGAVDTGRAGSASGVNNAVARAARLLAIAIQGLVVLAVFSSSFDRYLARLSLPSEARNMLIAQQSKLVCIALPAGLSQVAHAAIQQAISESFVTGFRVVKLIAARLALASAPSRVVIDRGHVTHKRCNAVVNGFPAPLAVSGMACVICVTPDDSKAFPMITEYNQPSDALRSLAVG
jgi:hypothetical protein